MRFLVEALPEVQNHFWKQFSNEVLYNYYSKKKFEHFGQYLKKVKKINFPLYFQKRISQGHHFKIKLESSTHAGSLQQDVQLFNFTSLSRKTPARLLPLSLDQLLSSRISSLLSPASPATEVFNPCWQPAAGHPTLQLHQPFQEDTSKATSSASGPASLQSDILTSFTGGLQQELQLQLETHQVLQLHQSLTPPVSLQQDLQLFNFTRPWTARC